MRFRCPPCVPVALVVVLASTSQAQDPPALVADLDWNGPARAPADLDGVAVFWRGDNTLGSPTELWRSDGTGAGTYRLNTLVPGGPLASYGTLTRMGSRLFFTATTASAGEELWATDGTIGGTRLVRDVRPNQTSTAPEQLTPVGNLLFFTGRTPPNGDRELYVTDGTFDGTVQVKEIAPGGIGSDPRGLIALRGELYFVADDAVHGRELWRSDGTETGTTMVAEVQPGTVDEGMRTEFASSSHVYFTRNRNPNVELWRSDGTNAGTLLLQRWNLHLGEGPTRFVEAGGQVYFTVMQSTLAHTLWTTDGSPAGTRELGSVARSPELLAVGEDLLVAREEAATGRELWILENSATSLRLWRDQVPGPASSFATPNFALANGRVLFTSYVSGRAELWGADPDGSAAEFLLPQWVNVPIPVGGEHVVYSSYEPATGYEYYRTDGTAAGTRRMPEIVVGPGSSIAQGAVLSGSSLLAMAPEATRPGFFDLWRLDAGAWVASIGHPTFGSAFTLRLESTRPVLGGSLDLRLSGVPSGFPFAVFAGPALVPRLSIGPIAWTFDPAGAVLLGSGLAGSTPWGASFAVPDDPALKDARLHAQAFAASGTLVESSNGLAWLFDANF